MYAGGVSWRRSRLLVALCAAVLAFVFSAGVGAANAAEAQFSARGSVEQVYVTGAAPGAQLSLVERRRPDGRHARRPTRSAARCSATSRPGAATASRASDGTESDAADRAHDASRRRRAPTSTTRRSRRAATAT